MFRDGRYLAVMPPFADHLSLFVFKEIFIAESVTGPFFWVDACIYLPIFVIQVFQHQGFCGIIIAKGRDVSAEPQTFAEGRMKSKGKLKVHCNRWFCL